MSKYYSGLAAVISTAPVEVSTCEWSDGLNFSAVAWALGAVGGPDPSFPLIPVELQKPMDRPDEATVVQHRAVDAECPEGRSLPEYRLGFVYWLVYKLGVLRPGIVDPPTFAELKERWG